MRNLFAGALFLALTASAYAAGNVRIDDNNVFPESLGSANGALYIGSSAKGIVYRAKPGSQYAEPWLQPPEGYDRVLGVLADASSNTLWVCYNTRGKASLHSFNLTSGVAKNAYDFPGGGLCNDIALKKGEAYVTDTMNGRILKLAKGAAALSEWWQASAEDRSLDGLVFTRDGKLYANAYNSSHLIRVDMNADGSAGKGTVLNTSVPINQPDGMRLSSSGNLLVVEAQSFPDNPHLKLGRVDEVAIDGDNAVIRVIKDGYEVPAGVTSIGSTIYVLETKFDYLRRTEMKGKDPGAFYAYAVPFQ
jgi:sugar lactone lactonase YvrE